MHVWEGLFGGKRCSCARPTSGTTAEKGDEWNACGGTTKRSQTGAGSSSSAPLSLFRRAVSIKDCRLVTDLRISRLRNSLVGGNCGKTISWGRSPYTALVLLSHVWGGHPPREQIQSESMESKCLQANL